MANSEPKSVDLTSGVRGKYYDRAMAGSNIVLLDPDLLETYPNSDAVNAALRSLKESAATPKREKTA